MKDLGSLLSNPFTAGRIGFDEGHPGIDFAYWSRPDRKTMQGHPIHSITSGVVASVINNRPPYGNSIIIETPIDQIPRDRLKDVSLAQSGVVVVPDARLNCPDFKLPILNPPTRNSLYFLYGHLDQPSTLKSGSRVECGDMIGLVGSSGFSVNYHLHLEVRTGPANLQLPLMAHYDNRATSEEMTTYCTWRASGLFMVLNPADLLNLNP